MRAIIDADPLVYIVGFGHQGMPLGYQCRMMDDFIDNVLEATEADRASLYLTGKGNYRFDVATIQPYKGNRDKSHKPEYYDELRDYLQESWNARLVEGMEADDACGIHAYYYRDRGKPYTICTIDKDLLMLEGRHYNYKRGEFETITETEGWRRFYLQTLTGDTSDNIPGLYKVTGTKATKGIKEPLQSITLCEEMDAYCLGQYVSAGSPDLDQATAIQQYREIQELLWILREPRTAPNFISVE